jgi:hypothetical protein
MTSGARPSAPPPTSGFSPCITARRAAGYFTRLPRLPPSSHHQEHLKHRPPPPPLTPLPFPLQLIAPLNAIKAAPHGHRWPELARRRSSTLSSSI